MVTLIRKLLEHAGYQRIATGSRIAEAISKGADADIILLDYQLPDGTGIETLPRLLSRPDPPSVIIVTGEGNETLAAAALRGGADDYVAKDNNLREMLPQIVERVRRNRALREAQTAVEQELVRAERVAAIGEMTVTLHHEINNPLMSASAEVELLIADPAIGGEQRAALETVREGLARVRDIVKRAGDLRQATSEDYLAGLRMINLGKSDRPAVSHRGRALLWIADEDTARLAAMVLRHRGFTVERVGSARELSTGASRLGVSLVVLTVAGSDRPEGAFAGFEPDPARDYAVVAMVAGNTRGASEAGADRTLILPFDPATLADDLTGAVDDRLTG